MKKKVLLVVLAIMGLSFGLRAQEYWIEGFYERLGEGKYTLKHIQTNGIELDGKTNLQGTLYGEKTSVQGQDGLTGTMIKFRFDKATTDCPSKWNNGFGFLQYWDEDNLKWKEDVESYNGSTIGYSQSDVVIMLVLDFSGSMSQYISSLRKSAKKLIHEIGKASNGNIHVGIIAFAGMDKAENQVMPITPITDENIYRFDNFIDAAQQGKETALYYSMDKAVKMIEDYTNRMHFSKKKYNGSYMITFTDGLDNASVNDVISPSMRRGSKNQYLAYVSNLLVGGDKKLVLGMPIEPFAVGFTGSEKFSYEDLRFFEDVLRRTTPDKDHFILSKDFDKVEAFFAEIAKNLTERWQNLQMYVGESQYGRVRWVLRCGEEPKPEPIKTSKPSPWWGISANYATGMSGDFMSYGLSLDMAFSVSESVALGGRIKLTMDNYQYLSSTYVSYTDYYGYYDGYWADSKDGDDGPGIWIGPEFKYTFPKNNAIIVGIGFAGLCSFNWETFYLQLGYKTKKSFYITVESLLAGDVTGVGVGLGFSFGGKRSK